MANEFKIKKGLIVTGASGGTVVDIQGSQGQLFSVTDDLSGSIFAVSDISGVPILDVNSSGTVNVDGTLNINNKVVIQTGTTYAQAADYLYIGGNDLGSGDAAIYLGNRGDGTGYGWRFYYAGIGSGNNNNLVIRSENLGSPVDAVTFNQDGFATFANKVRAVNWFQGASATNTLYSAGSTGLLLQTAGSTEDDNDSKIFFRNSGMTVKHTFNTHNGDATFVGQGFSAATSSGDASSTLTTKGYVDSLITGATIYRGAWDPSGGGYGSPDLSGVTQTSGYYYICSAAGTAEPNGTGTEPDTWAVGDWVIYNDVSGTGQWQKIDNSSVLSGVGTGQTVALWEGAGSVTDSETLGNAPITVSGNNATFAGDVVINSAGDATSPILRLNNSSSNTFNHALEAINDNLTAAETELLLFGKETNSRNSGFIGYNWNADNSDTNYVTIGHWGYNHLLKIYPTGTATFVGAVTSPTFLGDLNGTINTATTGVTQTAGNNSTLIATTAYADAAAAAVPIGNYLPLTGGTVTGSLATNGVLTIQNAAPYIQWKNVAGTRLSYIQHNATNLVMSADTGQIQLDTAADNDILINPGGTGKVGIGTTSPGAKLDVQPTASNRKVTKIANDVMSTYFYNTQADAVLAWTCGSYYQAEVVITANQTNGGTYNNIYIRGVWSNNHTSHHWDELERVGSLSGSTFTMSVGQDGTTTNSGRLELDFDYISGSFSQLNVRVTDFYGTHSYTIT